MEPICLFVAIKIAGLARFLSESIARWGWGKMAHCIEGGGGGGMSSVTN